MSKYQGLPDIDTAPDVFETADEPDTLLRPSDSGLGVDDDDAAISKTAVQSENIDSSGLPGRRKAERVFGRGTSRRDKSAPLTTFSLRPPHHSSLSCPGSSSSSSSDHSSDDDDPHPSSTRRRRRPLETPAARLRRLKAELAEVEGELAAGPSTSTSPAATAPPSEKRKSVLPPKEPVDLLGELSGLRERLSKLEVVEDERGLGLGESSKGDATVWQSRLASLGEMDGGPSAMGKDGGDDRPERVEGGSAPSRDPFAGLGDLDKRLALLEDVVGPSDASLDHTSPPLIPTLTKLDHLLTLLTQPRHLDAISRRVKLLLVDLDRAAAASRRPPQQTLAPAQPPSSSSPGSLAPTEHQTLQSLFALLPRLDPLLPILPPLLNRLRSLSGLHAQANDVAEGLRRLGEGDKRWAEELEEMRGVVSGIQRGLGEAGEAVRKNWQGLEGRMQGVEERLKRLEA